MNLITHKETQVSTLVMENSFAWTWSFSPSTCRITACALLISRFAWRTIKQTNNLLLIIKTKQNKQIQSFLINLAISKLPQASVLKWGEVQSLCRYENDFSFLYKWNSFYNKDIALSLVLKVTVFGTLLDMIIHVINRPIFRFHHHIRHL